MLYCPNCDNEYEEGLTACPDCGRPLEAAALEEAENPDIVLVPVYEAPNAYTAELVKGILEGEGIEVMLDGERTAVFDGVLSVESGSWGQVLVKDEDAERSLEIIAAYEKQAASTGGADDTA
ncbi:MAG: DUF2007 domain-containing protein [Armatimonadetes bacterium]|nr:DUF2007 domain-containing protein [Armatimonadota bacterium]